MSNALDLRWLTTFTIPAAHLVSRLTKHMNVYRRYIVAGSEIEALLSLTDQQLAARHLTRDRVGRAVLAKHGIALPVD